MDVREVIVNETLPQIPAGMVAFDLEMANSFANAPPVICMIGMERYDSEAGHCVSTIASITSRREEPELIEWFVRELSGLADRHTHPRLLSFSGLENDVPWLEQRLQRFDLPPEQSGTLERFEHVDLKAEFYRRTHSDHMSLKNLERIFGIGRESSIQSRKVSFILTDVMSSRRRGSSIPEKIFRYLHEDVHHLLLIYNRWEEVSLDEFRLTDEEEILPPFESSTDADGRLRFDRLPAGEYVLTERPPQAEEVARWVEIPDGVERIVVEWER
ncbi:MAG: ribonuclease H-like domain-containing protein [SAR324 cluster bacterium]|nr:ribonuclease H-like domain-containing protein [SAR324 cluster bacterium]